MVLARVAGAAVTWLHPDHLGSAVAGTGAAGSVVWRESEQPFGEDWISAPANDNQAGYTGHVEDAATGLVYMQARYYDPVTGRFLANDPVGFSPARPDMFNRYAYAANDPVNMTDSTGMCSEENSGSVVLCDFEDWIHKNISTPISNAVYAAADLARGAIGAPPIQRIDQGGEALQAFEAEFTSIGEEARQFGGRIAESAVENRNPFTIAKRTQGFHGNDRQSKRPTDLYHLVDRDDGSIQKTGITSRGEKRHSGSYLRRENVRLVTMYTFQSRYPAIVAENIELVHYRIEHGRLPRLNKVTR